MPVVENETEDPIEYRVNDDGREEGTWAEIVGNGQGTISYEGKKYHQIEWLGGTVQRVPSNEDIRKYLSSAVVTIHADKTIDIVETTPPTGEVVIHNNTEDTIVYRATLRSHIFKVSPSKNESFNYGGLKFHQIRRHTDVKFKNVADRRLPSEIKVIVHNTGISFEPPLESLPEPAEAVQSAS